MWNKTRLINHFYFFKSASAYTQIVNIHSLPYFINPEYTSGIFFMEKDDGSHRAKCLYNTDFSAPECCSVKFPVDFFSFQQQIPFLKYCLKTQYFWKTIKSDKCYYNEQ